MADMVAVAFGGASVGLLLVALAHIGKTSAAVGRLEKKVDALLKHAGLDSIK